MGIDLERGEKIDGVCVWFGCYWTKMVMVQLPVGGSTPQLLWKL